ncbi:NADP-dependent oxidoreductase [Allobranchiibius sp. GilTou38]|uniref:quinone oxidoreductase family protein n=1 Tax=Allobranchiibius sp. GilTou38 TaxID=2815210 RepID=UPI001AA12E94|nr:NADP-dependent oxidoreductase [Allobranchiibius sp. GilTou38]MBO1766555.1 NADP-dependent oxidoreductase [Allobranchiibius sp. GilTou38]
MRAIGFEKPGDPDVLREFDLPAPQAGPGEVRVHIEAVAVNPSDTATRSGAFADRYREVATPHLPGWDFAGTVDQVGAGVAHEVGQLVMGATLPVFNGAYAEYVVVPSANVVAVPHGVDAVAACTVPMNGLTALLTLERFDLEPGAWIAVTGAAGAYGGSLIEIACARGLHVVADASEADEQLVRDLGAEEVVRRGDDVARRIREVRTGGVDALADGAVQGAVVLPAVQDAGAYVAVRAGDITSERGITVDAIMVGDVVSDPDRIAAGLATLADLVRSGRLTPRVARTLPAAEAPRAHRALEAGGVRGRQVLTF